MGFYNYVTENWMGLALCAVLAFMPPIMIIFAAHEIRFRRLRLIIDYESAFSPNSAMQGKCGAGAFREDGQNTTDRADRPTPSEDIVPSNWDNPTFEFVKSKYISDIRTTEVTWVDASRTADSKITSLLQAPPSFLRVQTH